MASIETVNGLEVRSPKEAAPCLAIDAVIVPKLSFASHQNAVPVLRDLKVLNLGGGLVENVVVHISADPPVFEPAQWQIDRIAAGAESHITKRDLKLNAGLLLHLTEAVLATVTLRVHCADAGEAPVAQRDFPVDLLARNEWGGAATMPELLAAFSLPNDPTVSKLLKAASEVLRRAGRPDGIEGYQSKSRTRVHELASAIWSAVSSLRLTYAEPPASFELQGQKVRTPSQAVEAGLATCLDTALMFTALIEQAGLYPVIVLTRGHAFAGVWLQPQEFATLLVHDAASLRKRVALQELVLFETTLATGAHPGAFSRAIAQAIRQINEEHEANFVLAIDIRRARMQRLRPLAMASADGASSTSEPEDVDPAGDALEAAPALPDFDLAEPEAAPTSAQGRLERWQRKLLDLTTRNRLLNVKPGATVIRLLCPDPAGLEDRLADGANFRIVAAPQMEGEAGRDATLHLQRTGEVLDQAYARDALERGEILSLSPPDKLDAQLIELYRKTRLDLAEGGANTLFLAIGFLLWRKSESDTRHYRAPLLLLPVKLERRSVRSGVKLSAQGDEPRFNLTLLQMLRQDFDLDIPELSGPLPTDDSGIDVPRIWNLVRRAVRDTPGFEVAEDVVLSSFSFAKYLMWKDLVDRTDALKGSPVVRHLLETPREPYDGCQDPPRPDELDALIAPDELFTPLPADSSQLSAVVGSARGCDFVLDGPPGTGKSQTIANMIAHNLALGRKVLFVAEKRAALDVVHRRLLAHGLGPFCLELHSNKASKQDVLRQLDAAWTSAEASPAEAWARHAAELKTSRDHLNCLVEVLHRRRSNGLTLHDAIGRVVRDGAEQALRLSWPHALSHSEADLDRLRETARRVDLHRPDASDVAAFAPVGRTEWSNAWQSDMLVRASGLARAAAVLAEARAGLLAQLGVELDADLRGLAATGALAAALQQARGFDLSFAFGSDAPQLLEQAARAAPLVRAYRNEAAALSKPQDPSVVRGLPLSELEAAWDAANKAIWPLSIYRKKAVATRLDPAGAADPEADLPRAGRMQKLLAELDTLELAGALPGWACVETNLDRLDQMLEVAGGLRGAIVSGARTSDQLIALRGAIRRLSVDANEMLAPEGAIGRACQDYIDAHGAFVTAKTAFEDAACSPVPIDGEDVLAEVQAVAGTIAGRATQLHSWTAWRRARQAALDLDLGALVEAIEGGALPQGRAAEAFDLAYARWWAEVTIDDEPVVRDFHVVEHKDAIERFRTLDQEFAKLTQLYIRARIAEWIRRPVQGLGALGREGRRRADEPEGLRARVDRHGYPAGPASNGKRWRVGLQLQRDEDESQGWYR